MAVLATALCFAPTADASSPPNFFSTSSNFREEETAAAVGATKPIDLNVFLFRQKGSKAEGIPASTFNRDDWLQLFDQYVQKYAIRADRSCLSDLEALKRAAIEVYSNGDSSLRRPFLFEVACRLESLPRQVLVESLKKPGLKLTTLYFEPCWCITNSLSEDRYSSQFDSNYREIVRNYANSPHFTDEEVLSAAVQFGKLALLAYSTMRPRLFQLVVDYAVSLPEIVVRELGQLVHHIALSSEPANDLQLEMLDYLLKQISRLPSSGGIAAWASKPELEVLYSPAMMKKAIMADKPFKAEDYPYNPEVARRIYAFLSKQFGRS